MRINGNFGNYAGTGEPIGGQVATGTPHCVFTPPVPNPDSYVTSSPPCTIPATPEQHGDHQAAVEESCTFPAGTAFPPGTSANDYIHTTPIPCVIPPTPGWQTTTVVGADVGIDQ